VTHEPDGGRFTTPPPDVEAILNQPAPPPVRYTWFTDVKTTRLDWLWYPYLAQDAINFLSGDPGCGKSYVCQTIAAALSQGDAFFNSNGHGPSPASRVLYLFAEGDLDKTIVPRMELIGMDKRQIVASQGRGEARNDYLTLDRPDLLEPLLDQLKPKLVIFDPIESFMGKCNPNAAEEVRPRLDYLADTASNHHFTPLGIRFDRKAAADKAQHKSAGSIAWMAAGRSFLGCVEDPDRPRVNSAELRATYGVFAHIKVNDAPLGPSLAYSIVDTPSGIGQFEWTGVSIRGAGELLSTRKDEAKNSTTALDKAKRFLVTTLRKGPESSDNLILEAENHGICSRATLFTAKKELGIRAQKKGFGELGSWEWYLSEVDLPSEFQD